MGVTWIYPIFQLKLRATWCLITVKACTNKFKKKRWNVYWKDNILWRQRNVLIRGEKIRVSFTSPRYINWRVVLNFACCEIWMSVEFQYVNENRYTYFWSWYFDLKFQLISLTVKKELNLLTFLIMRSEVNDLHWFYRLCWKPEQLFI